MSVRDSVQELALQPWRTNPYRLVNWLDMQQFSARAFYLMGVSLEEFQLELINAALTRTGHLVNTAAFDLSIDDASRAKAVKCLEGLDHFCASIGLNVSALSVGDLQLEILTKPLLNYNTVIVKFNGLRDMISREMMGRTFMYITAERAQHYGVSSLFGEKVGINFLSAAFDIAESGNCLDTARGTACVFHLMRVLEIGLTALGKVFGVSVEHTNWGPAIEECEKKIKNMNQDPKWRSLPDGKDQQEFYSQAISYLGVAKNAWRNYTAHARGKYTEEEADLMFRNIRAFMQKLAERLTE